MQDFAQLVYHPGAPFSVSVSKQCGTGTAGKYFDLLSSHNFHVHSASTNRPSGIVSYPSDPLSFLIAEDDDELRFIIVQLLWEKFPQARVAAYANGRDALADYDVNGARLVVSNHSMPVMDGPAFVRQLRLRSSSLPILMVSGSPEARQEGRAAGISCFLDKDELHSSLTAAVRALLDDTGLCCVAPRSVLRRAGRQPLGLI